VWVLGGSPDISGNVIVGSHWGIYCQTQAQYPPSLPIVGCNLFWDVVEIVGPDCDAAGSVVWAAPLFCEPMYGDFSVCADSPAISDSCGCLGAFGIGCPPCGEVDRRPTTWGALKSRYR
jgi:hypothetical protein